MKKLLLRRYPLIVILLSALALRINLIFHRGTFWFDEKFSTHYSVLPSWADTLKYWAIETNPPLYTFFLRFYIPMVQTTNETIVRLPSVIFGVISIILLYILAEKLFSQSAAIISSIFLSLSSLHLVVSTEARTYSLFVMLTILSFYIFHKIVFENCSSKKIWILYTITNLLLIYSHLTATLAVLIQFLIINIVPLTKQIKKQWYISQIIAGFLWLFWFIPSVLSKLNLNIGSAWYFSSTPEGTFPIGNLLLLPFIGTLSNSITNTLFLIILFIGVYFFIQDIKSASDDKRNLLLLISLWAFLPLFFSSILGVFIPKYTIMSYPGLFLLAGYMGGKLATNNKKLLMTVIAVLFLTLSPGFTVANATVFSYNEFNSYIKENETPNSIVFLPFIEVLCFRDYYTASSPLVGLYLQEDNMSFEERIVRYNWSTVNTTKEEYTDWVNNQLEKVQADKIFLIQQFEEQVMIHEILLENGWIIKHKEKAPGYYNYYLYEFNAPNN